jgi:LacI family transcriptional regulator
MKNASGVRQFRKSTIKEVAAQAGVSITTVSLFVSGRESVCSPETAQRIKHAVAKLNYTPNSLTKGLRQRSLTTIGVCMPNPLDYDLAFGSLYFEGLWRGIMHQADHEDYSLLHYPASVRDGTGWEVFLDGRVDGLLVHDHKNGRPSHLAAAGMPLVLLTRSVAVPEGCGAVWVDENRVIDVALSHLWDLGHRRIAHIAGPIGSRAHGVPAPETDAWVYNDDVAVQRLNAYVAWMANRGAFDPLLVGYAQAWSAPQAPEMLKAWMALEEPPTAVACANDAQALDIIAAAQEAGLRIPEDLSVIGVDNSPQARDSVPPLTSVEVRMEEVGRHAVMALLRMMKGEPLERCRTAIPLGSLVVRSSTAAPP